MRISDVGSCCIAQKVTFGVKIDSQLLSGKLSFEMDRTSSAKVSFSATVSTVEVTDDDFSSSEESFREIVTTSEAESFSSSDEEDAERVEMIFERAYTCSPSMFSRPSPLAPAERSSLLLLDKDLLNDGEMSEGVCVCV